MRRAPTMLACLVLALLGLGGDARAADGALPDPCAEWFGRYAIALVCDPAQRGGERLAIRARGKTVAGEAGVAQMGGSEPFSLGESVELDFTGGGPGTVAALVVVRQGRTHAVLVEPFTSARRYTATVAEAGVHVRAEDGAVREIPFPAAPVAPGPQPAATPADAVRSFVRLMAAGDAEPAAACDMLSADARDGLSSDGLDCPGMLAMLFYYQGDTGQDRLPEYRRTAVGAVRVVRAAGLTIARVRLRHHFVPERGQPRSAGAVATVPVVHEPGGWRVATPLTLMPAAALDRSSAPTGRQLRTHLAELARGAAKVRAARAARSAATTPVGAAEPCVGPVATAGDPQADVALADGGFRAERQDAAHVDVLAVRHARGPVPCFELALRTPLPEAFELELRVMSAPDRRWPGQVGHDDMRVEIAGPHAIGSSRDSRSPDETRWSRVVVGLSPDRRTITIRPAPAALWTDIPLTSGYRWTVTLFETDPERDVTYMERVPEDQQIEPGAGFPAPPVAPASG